MLKLWLYSTDACHLCELAKVQIELWSAQYGEKVEFEEVDIANDDALMALYGVRIPVITIEPCSEGLGWPFDVHAINAFVLATKAV